MEEIKKRFCEYEKCKNIIKSKPKKYCSDACRNKNRQIKSRKSNGFWNYENCKSEALKFENKSEFQLNSAGAYNSIRVNNWAELTSHFIPVGNKYNRLIYAYEFVSNNIKAAYVGLTCNIRRRNIQHLISDTSSSVYKYMKESGIKPNLISKSNYIPVKDAILLEESIKQEYENNGWTILNKMKTGGIGGNQKKWSKELCTFEAKKYDKIVTFMRKSSGAYKAAIKNGWFDEITSHIRRRKTINGYFNNYDLCKKAAQQCKSRSDLFLHCWAAYNYSTINNWLDEFYPKN